MFSSIALLNKGAIYSTVKPAIPQPISVTKNFELGFESEK